MGEILTRVRYYRFYKIVRFKNKRQSEYLLVLVHKIDYNLKALIVATGDPESLYVQC